MYFQSLNLLFKYFDKKEQIEFAKIVLATQDIFEESWDDNMSKYGLRMREAAEKAVNQINPECKNRSELLSFITAINDDYWNDSQYVAEELLKKYKEK